MSARGSYPLRRVRAPSAKQAAERCGAVVEIRRAAPHFFFASFFLTSTWIRFLIHNDYLTFYRVEEETKIIYVFAVFNGRLDYTRALNKYL